MLPKKIAGTITILAAVIGIPVTILAWMMLGDGAFEEGEGFTVVTLTAWTITFCILLFYASLDTLLTRKIPGFPLKIDHSVAMVDVESFFEFDDEEKE